MIVYLGQSVQATSSLLGPAIVTGFTVSGVPRIAKLKFDGTIAKDEVLHQSFLKPLRIKDKNSPSGQTLYLGTYCRNVSPKGPIDIKMPTDVELRKEFDKIKELIAENAKDDNDQK